MNLALLAILLQQMHHSRPPVSPFEYLLAGIATVAAAYALVLAVRMTVHPGEESPGHIKRVILKDWEAPREQR